MFQIIGIETVKLSLKVVDQLNEKGNVLVLNIDLHVSEQNTIHLTDMMKTNSIIDHAHQCITKTYHYVDYCKHQDVT